MIKKSKKRTDTNRLDIRKNVKKLVAGISRMDAGNIKESDNIRDDLGIDSLMAMEILAAIEKRLGITIDEARILDVVSVRDLIDLVIVYLKKKKR